jgi:hypothetical protein
MFEKLKKIGCAFCSGVIGAVKGFGYGIGTGLMAFGEVFLKDPLIGTVVTGATIFTLGLPLLIGAAIGAVVGTVNGIYQGCKQGYEQNEILIPKLPLFGETAPNIMGKPSAYTDRSISSDSVIPAPKAIPKVPKRHIHEQPTKTMLHSFKNHTLPASSHEHHQKPLQGLVSKSTAPKVKKPHSISMTKQSDLVNKGGTKGRKLSIPKRPRKTRS